MGTANFLKRTIGPVLPLRFLHRPALVSTLNEAVARTLDPASGKEAAYKLILLSAPAGYGKTTLLADFAAHTQTPCCWYFLEHADNDKSIFFELLLASIRQCFPHFGVTLDNRLTNAISTDAGEPAMPYRLDSAIDMLVAAIAAEIPERFALILCNYHEVNQNQEINHLVNRLILHVPPQCILILESRAVPRLEFASLLAHREILGIGSNALRFSAGEICDLARLQNIVLSDAEAADLVQSFDGWITGILLGTHLGDLRYQYSNTPLEVTWNPPLLKMDRDYLFAYLAREVFMREPLAYAFLQEAIILRQMTPSLCAALLDIPDAAKYLAHLERQGLFVTRYRDGSQEHYICHPALRALLYDELHTRSPERLTALHLRAVDLFRGTQDDEAIFHALAAAAYDVAADLIESVCKPMFAQGRYTSLAYWIDSLPLETAALHPKLLLTRANIFLAIGEYVQAQPLLDRALAAVEQDSGEEAVLLAEIQVARASMLSRQGDYTGAQALCRQALAVLPADEVMLRAEAHRHLGVCASLLNNFTASVAELQQALQLCGHETSTRQVAKLHTVLANSYAMLGHHALSEHHRTRAIHCWEQLSDEWGKINNLIGLGATRQRLGDLAEAERVLMQALDASRGTIRYKSGEAYALVSLGDIYQDQDRYKQALSAYEDGLILARQQKDTYLVHCASCALAMTYLLMNDSQTALLLIPQTDQDERRANLSHSYEYAVRDLTMGSVLLQQHRYSEAYALLTAAETAFAGAKREQLQAQIRIAACLYEQGDTRGALDRIKETIIQAGKNDYEHLVRLELSRAPDLQRLLQTASESTTRDSFVQRVATNSDVTPTGDLPLLPAISSSDGREVLRLRILALGEPEVLINDLPIRHWRMARAMELFFLLLNSDRSLYKEQIITALWLDSDEQVDQTLRSTFYYLRKVLGASCITSRNATYALNLAAAYGNNIWYDVAAFEEQYEVAQAALAAQNDQVAGSAFEEMTRLYRGDYVQSFYSNWCIARRDNLRHAFMDAHHQLALIAWRHQQLDKSILHWQSALTMDSCLESAHYGLMRCYVRQGKRGMALRQYQRCVTSMRDELSASPGQAMQRLYQRIMKTT